MPDAPTVTVDAELYQILSARAGAYSKMAELLNDALAVLDSDGSYHAAEVAKLRMHLEHLPMILLDEPNG